MPKPTEHSQLNNKTICNDNVLYSQRSNACFL